MLENTLKGLNFSNISKSMDEIRNSEVKQQTTERIIYNELTKRQNKLKEIVSQYEQIQKVLATLCR